MISLRDIQILANMYLEQAGYKRDKAIVLASELPNADIRVKVINRIKDCVL